MRKSKHSMNFSETGEGVEYACVLCKNNLDLEETVGTHLHDFEIENVLLGHQRILPQKKETRINLALYHFLMAAVTKCYKWFGLNKRHVFSYCSGSYMSVIKGR